MNRRGLWIILVIVVAVIAFLSTSKMGNLAVLEIQGPILESQPILRQIESLRKSDKVKAVVIRVNSPGGAVGASQEIHDGIKSLAEKKKVVASFGNVAASGGYYVAVPAHKIFANLGTITGSIGVRMEYVNVEELLQWGKLKKMTLKSGRLKDVGSATRPMSPEEKEYLESLLATMHGQFKKAVQEGRSMAALKIEKLADGRVFTGEEAKKNGLIDEIGNINAAIESVSALAGIEGEPDVFYAPREYDGWFDKLLSEASARFTSLLRAELKPRASFSFIY